MLKLLHCICFVFLWTVLYSQNRLESVGSLPSDLQNIYNGQNFDGSQSKVSYQKEQNEMIRSFILSGKIVYGDPISHYLNKIMDNLIPDDKLRKEIKIYVLKDNRVNASATVDGFVFVNTGLVAQCETEDELAFVLAHEVAHYVKKHGTKNRKHKNNNIDDFLAHRYSSREDEREADEVGYEMFFKDSKYSAKSVFGTFDVLEFGYLPFDEIALGRNSFENEYFKFDDKYYLSEVTPITRFTDDTDTLSTHPNLNARRERMQEIIGNTVKKTEKSDKKDFAEIQKMARYEVIRQEIADDNYLKAYYNTLVMDSLGDKSNYLKVLKAASLYGIASAKISGQYAYIDIKKEDIEGEFQRVAWFFKQITRNECALLSLRATWDILKNETENPYLNSLFTSVTTHLNSVKNINSLNRFSDYRQGEEPEDTGQNADTLNTSKYDKLKQSSVKVGTQKGFKTENYMLADLKQNADFVKKFNSAINAGKRNETEEFIQNYSKNTKTDIKKLLVLRPYVVDEAKKSNVLFPKSFENHITSVGQHNGFETIIISQNNQTLPCSYQALSRLNDYANSLNRFSEETFENYDTQTLQTEFGSAVINLIKYTKSPVKRKSTGNKYYKRVHTLLSLMDLPALPLSVIQWFGQKRYGTLDFTAYNLANSKKLYQTQSDFVMESTPDELKQELHDCYSTLNGNSKPGYLNRRLHLLVDTRISPSGLLQKYKAEPVSLLRWNYFIQPSVEYVLNKKWVIGASFQYQTPFKYEPKFENGYAAATYLPVAKVKALGGSFYSKTYFSGKAPIGYYFKMQADYFNMKTNLNEIYEEDPESIVSDIIIKNQLNEENSNYFGFRLETGKTIVLANRITLNTGISFGLLTTSYKDWTRTMGRNMKPVYPTDCAHAALLTNYLLGVNIGIGFLAF